MARRKPRMITPKEYAANHGKSRDAVMKWLQRNLVPGAIRQPAPEPFTGYVYWIPEDAPAPNLKPGPKPGAKKKASKKGRK
jgi:hypothetical protein